MIGLAWDSLITISICFTYAFSERFIFLPFFRFFVILFKRKVYTILQGSVKNNCQQLKAVSKFGTQLTSENLEIQSINIDSR